MNRWTCPGVGPETQKKTSPVAVTRSCSFPLASSSLIHTRRRIGPQPKETNYPALNASPVVPPEFPAWGATMDMWGTKMLASVHTLAGMAALGLDLPPTSFQDLLHEGPHLLAPTGSDFSKYGALGSVLAGYHYDLNFLTIHGKSRFPGLFVWLKNGTRMAVKVPTGHLIVQAGKQLEHLTAGHVQAGFHEVVVSDATVRAKGGQALWGLFQPCLPCWLTGLCVPQIV